MDVLHFSRRPRREFKPVRFRGTRRRANVRYQIDAESNETDFIPWIILYCPFPIVVGGWATLIKLSRLKRVDDDVSRFVTRILYILISCLFPLVDSSWNANFVIFYTC